MSALRLTALAVVCLVAQVSYVSDIRLFGISSDVMLLMSVVAGALGGAHRGAVVGFGFGLAFDLALESPFGLSALAYSLTGYLAGLVSDSIGSDSRARLAMTTAVTSSIGIIIFALAGALFGNEHYVSGRLVGIAVVVGLFNGVLSIGARPMMVWSLESRPSGAGT